MVQSLELVRGQYIMEVREKPNTCSPLSVVENRSGQKRLVVNMRHVNKFLLEFQIRGRACSHDVRAKVS